MCSTLLCLGADCTKSFTIPSLRVSTRGDEPPGRQGSRLPPHTGSYKMKTLRRRSPVDLTIPLVALVLLIPFSGHAQSDDGLICSDNSSYSKRQLDSKRIDNLCETYRGKVMLVVNTASRCAFTDQYDGLEKIYSRYRDRGLVVLGFPSNDFGNQEPGSEVKIKKFCRLTYGVQFPMYAKSRVMMRIPSIVHWPMQRALRHAGTFTNTLSIVTVNLSEATTAPSNPGARY